MDSALVPTVRSSSPVPIALNEAHNAVILLTHLVEPPQSLSGRLFGHLLSAQPHLPGILRLSWLERLYIDELRRVKDIFRWLLLGLGHRGLGSYRQR